MALSTVRELADRDFRLFFVGEVAAPKRLDPENRDIQVSHVEMVLSCRE
ncbi:MAG: hypothetical protein U0941_16070 [Planctomycetaceae bacterium]